GWLATRWSAPGSWRRALAAAALWPLAEWARSVIFTGFPWLSFGYATLPGGSTSALAGYAPIGGVFLVSLALAVDAIADARRVRAALLVGGVAVIGAGGATLQRIEWSTPIDSPLAVSLVQGNITQDVKFDPGFRDATFDLYAGMVRQSRG